jgi:hypothetical protein
MLAFPPRAQLGKSEDCDITLSSRTVSPLLSPLTIPQSESLSIHSTRSLPRSEHVQPTKRPSLRPTDSPLSGSTLCPTPQSTQSEYEDKEDFEDTPWRKPSGSVTSFDKILDPSSYTVETLQQIDDAGRVAPWRCRVYRLSPLTTLISMVAYFLYYTYRIYCTLDAQRAFDKVHIMAWIFITAEGCVACERSS